MLNKTRIYDDKIDIDNKDVKSFWEKRASLKDLNAVLLGNQQDSKHSDLRNKKELTLLKSFINDEIPFYFSTTEDYNYIQKK